MVINCLGLLSIFVDIEVVRFHIAYIHYVCIHVVYDLLVGLCDPNNQTLA